MENDLLIHPEYTDYEPFFNIDKNKNKAKKAEGKCPFSFLKK